MMDKIIELAMVTTIATIIMYVKNKMIKNI